VLLSAKRGRIDAADIGVRAGSAPPPAPTEDALTLREAEREAIVRALERFPDDRMAAARSLGLSRSAFYRRLTQMGLVRRQR